jgi:hypothetical protein
MEIWKEGQLDPFIALALEKVGRKGGRRADRTGPRPFTSRYVLMTLTSLVPIRLHHLSLSESCRSEKNRNTEDLVLKPCMSFSNSAGRSLESGSRLDPYTA